MQQKEEKKQIYEVVILKYDNDHISVVTTDKYDESYERWRNLTDTWISALKDKTPFILESPIVTAFDPGTIKEVLIRPVVKMEESKYQNPYQQQMVKNGLSNMLKNGGANIINPDLLDEGYSS